MPSDIFLGQDERLESKLLPLCLTGEEILRQGWPATQIYFMRSGYVDLIMNKAVVDTLRDGDYFGEAALMELPSPQELQQVSPASCLISFATFKQKQLLDGLQ